MIGQDLTGIILDWRTWLAMVVLVFTPGLILRVALLVYPRGDERRIELLAEMYAVPVWRRPLWVIQQVEVVVWEGIPERWYQFAVGHVIYRWKLHSGEKSNREHPKSFWIPPREDREAVPIGYVVKLMFMMRDGWGERMWVRVEGRRGNKYVGTLRNTPVGIPALDPGDRIKFTAADIIDIDIPSEDELCSCEPQDMCDCDRIVNQRCEVCGSALTDENDEGVGHVDVEKA